MDRDYLLFNSLLTYFEHKINHDAFIEILQNDCVVSLRMIEWFVTKFAKIQNTSYEIDGKVFEVYASYKSQLKIYSKKLIDPFCRRDRLALNKHDTNITTTIGQMNFFRWAIENGVIKHIVDNFDELEKEMKRYSKKANENRRNKCVMKKNEAAEEKVTPLNSSSAIIYFD